MGPRRTQARGVGAHGGGRNAVEEEGANGSDQAGTISTDLAPGSGALESEETGNSVLIGQTVISWTI